MSIAVRIESNNKDEIVVKRIDYNRFEFHGFGSFVWKVQKDEISISQKAFDLLRTRVGDKYSSMGDLAGIDLSHNTTQYKEEYNGYTVNYAFLGPELSVPLEDVIIDLDFYEFLKDIPFTEDSPEQDIADVSRWVEIERLEKTNQDKKVNKIIKEYYKSSR